MLLTLKFFSALATTEYAARWEGWMECGQASTVLVNVNLQTDERMPAFTAGHYLTSLTHNDNGWEIASTSTKRDFFV